MITQIYSIQTVEEALGCVSAGADYIGIAAGASKDLPAKISLEKGKEIFEAVKGKVKRVALTVEDTPDEIYHIVKTLSPDVIHLCGDIFMATPEFCKQVRKIQHDIEVLQAIAITGQEAIERAKHYSSFCDILILDSVDPSIAGIGAAGVVNDWNVCAEIVKQVNCKVILAGGLGPDNVSEAIDAVRPWGVDSLTNTNKKLPDGSFYKDLDKVSRFVKNAKESAAKLGL